MITRKYFFINIVILTLILLVISFLSLGVGVVRVSPVKAFKAIFSSSYAGIKTIVREIRLPRILASIIIGGLLAISGVLMQSCLRNPLAEPYILGLSAGALTGVWLSLLISPKYFLLTSFAAFIGALSALCITLALSSIAGGGVYATILAGIIVNVFFTGISTILSLIVQASRHLILVYHPLTGSLSTITWVHIKILALTSIFIIPIVMSLSKPLNCLLLGEEYVRQVGYDPKLTYYASLILASLIAAITVSIAGIIGFIGIIIPHMIRLMYSSDHRVLLPFSFLIGGIVLQLADAVSRIFPVVVRLSSGELPVGIIMDVIGAPFFAYVLIKSLRKG